MHILEIPGSCKEAYLPYNDEMKLVGLILTTRNHKSQAWMKAEVHGLSITDAEATSCRCTGGGCDA